MINYILQGIGMGIGMGIVVVIYLIIEQFCKYKMQKSYYKELKDYIKKFGRGEKPITPKPEDMEYGNDKPDTKFKL